MTATPRSATEQAVQPKSAAARSRNETALIAIFCRDLAAGQSQCGSQTTIGDAVPIVINPQFDAFYVTETPVVNGGEYTIHNNTANLTLVGFGVSNPTSSPSH